MSERPTWVRWRITILLVVASFIDYFLRYHLTIAAPAMIPSLGVSEIQWGWVLAAFPLGYAIFQLPGGAAADRFGPRRVLALAMLAWGALVALTALVPAPPTVPLGLTIALLIAIGFAVGTAHAPIYPTVACTVRRWFPLGRWALPNGLTSTGLTWGSASVAALLTALIGLAGWRVAFLLLAPVAVVASAVWWWYARDFPAQHQSVNAAELELITANRPGYAAKCADPGSWRLVLKNRDLLLLTLAYSCMNYGYYTVFSWFFYYLHNVLQAGEQVAVTVTALQWIAGGLAAALGGLACDWLCRRFGLRWGCRGPIVLAMLANGILLLAGLLTTNLLLASACFVGFFFFNQFTEGPFWASSMAIGRRLAGSASGVMNTGANAMGVIMTLLAPIIAASFSWTVSIGTAAPFAFVSAALMMFVRSDLPIQASASDAGRARGDRIERAAGRD
jgi:MFS transporter, ACS family, glucarate transporter